MKPNCPYQCPSNSSKISKYGNYLRKSDSRIIQRYKCQLCGKGFSSATSSLCFGQKKRRVNELLFKLLCSGVSMRRCALILNIHRKTVQRKLKFLAKRARINQLEFLSKLKDSPVTHLEIDDLITIEHTKLKPLSVSIAVDGKNRALLDVQVSQIPSFGHLAAISRRKYGYRKSLHAKGLKRLFKTIEAVVDPKAVIQTDEHKLYPPLVQNYFPNARYQQHKSEKACVAGQGELKKVRRDPLFAINHTLAMCRANINRLVRRTWCTTKDPQMLLNHLQIYMDFHNRCLLKMS